MRYGLLATLGAYGRERLVEGLDGTMTPCRRGGESSPVLHVLISSEKVPTLRLKRDPGALAA
jgi:hypothetical protein